MSKRKSIVFLVVFLLLGTAFSAANEPLEKSLSSYWQREQIKSIGFDTNYTPTEYECSVIYFILKNTSELNIHRMRGEEGNQVFIKESETNGGCFEQVFNAETGGIVTNSYNQGSFNYYFYKTEPVNHFLYDMLPWLELGNTRDDPTSFNERLYAYTLDLNLGIQTYIFKGRYNSLKKIKFSKLSEDEKMTYRLFVHLLFNKEYKIALNEKNKKKLKNSGDFYWSYFYQMHDLLKIKKK